jgi:hypothetical protein
LWNRWPGFSEGINTAPTAENMGQPVAVFVCSALPILAWFLWNG